jgi:hypothetical protein
LLAEDYLITDISKIKSGTPLLAPLSNGDRFGFAIAALGDFDGDGIGDIAVGAPYDDTGCSINCGAVHLLFLNNDTTLKGTLTLASGSNGMPTLTDYDNFGFSVSWLGDVDGDGVGDIAVGAPGDDTGEINSSRGAVYILMLNGDGTVKSSTKIASSTGGLGLLTNFDEFGTSVVGLGDINGDFIPDIAVGTPGDDTTSTGDGAGEVYIIRLSTTGNATTVYRLLSDVQFSGLIDDDDKFGSSLAAIGDVNLDGIQDIAIGAIGDATGSTSNSPRGAVYIVSFMSDGSVKEIGKLASGVGGFGSLSDYDEFGISVSSIGDINYDGVPDISIGAWKDDTGSAGGQRGATYLVSLNSDLSVKYSSKIAHNRNGFGPLVNNDFFGASVAPVGDVNADGVIDLSVGAAGDDSGGSGRGAVYIMAANLDADSNGIPDAVPNGLIGLQDTDGDGIVNAIDPDADGDGTPNSLECISAIVCPDTDKDNIPDYLDPDTNASNPGGNPGGDTDGDGISDADECSTGVPCTDTDSDGIPDYLEPNDLDVDGDGLPSTQDQDSDNDGTPDGDECPNLLSCGTGDVDGDGIPDYLDPDTNASNPGGNPGGDTDGDGISDADECPTGVPCTDTDSDGIPDYLEPNDLDVDGDGLPSNQDQDSDNDGTPDGDECATPFTCHSTDADGDGIPDYLDSDTNASNPGGNPGGDTDGDGISDADECSTGVPCTDSDGDGIPDYLENNNSDLDGDGIPDHLDSETQDKSVDDTNLPGGVIDINLTSLISALSEDEKLLVKRAKQAIRTRSRGPQQCSDISRSRTRRYRKRVVKQEKNLEKLLQALPTSVKVNSIVSAACTPESTETTATNSIAKSYSIVRRLGLKSLRGCEKRWRKARKQRRGLREAHNSAENSLAGYKTSSGICQ